MERPLIFVAHSLGGLVCAEIMVMGARRAFGDNASVIARHTRGIIFFGTPFRGSKSAQPAEIARKIFSAFGGKTQEKTLKLLGVDSETLDNLNTAFQETMRRRNSSDKPEDKVHAMFFYETLLTYGTMVIHPKRREIQAYLWHSWLSAPLQRFPVVAIVLLSTQIILICVNSRHRVMRVIFLLLL